MTTLSAKTPTDGLSSIDHIVVLMLENRSMDHMLGYLYAERANVSPTGDPFEGLTGHESNDADDGRLSRQLCVHTRVGVAGPAMVGRGGNDGRRHHGVLHAGSAPRALRP